MDVVLVWLSRQAIFIYFICLLGALGYVFAAVAAKRRRDSAQFSLEREVYQQRLARNWLMAALCLMLGGMVFMVRAFVLPPPPDPNPPTPTVSFGLLTPTPTLIAPMDSLTATEMVTPVVVVPPDVDVLAPTPSPTPVPRDQYQPDCPSPDVQLTLPVAGSELSGAVEVRGTARMNAFAYYKFEVRFPGSDVPNFISQYDRPVTNDVLGVWDVSDPARYPPGGPYSFQLVVVDIYGNITMCTVPVDIVSPEG